MSEFGLVRVREQEFEELAAMFAAYHDEIAPLDPLEYQPASTLELREEMLGGAEDEDWYWIESEDRHVGFIMSQAYEDEPGERTAEILECYVQPEYRRRGLARRAVEELMTRERAQGTALVEAAVLRDNAGAVAFWEACGFQVRTIVTARRP